ncbi:MAG: hypothetical protein HOV81_27560 [Kofleriaceae bacterium]|nr:hypothetical protein [Kofleriaceae bacterium]
MRQEDKEVDGPDIEHAEERKRESELVEEDDEELYDLDGQNEYERDHTRNGSVIGAMKTILDGEHIVVNDLDLDRRELVALEALQTATRGRDGKLDHFVYAEDRRTLLEQALAVLQPDIQSLAELGKPYEEMMQQVSELREALNVLQDAQEEAEHRLEETKGQESDSDDKPEDDTSLDGPERKVKKPESSLGGPERKEEPKPASTLSGPERKEDKKPESSLTGSERKEDKKPSTSLGDPADIADAEKKLPWWRRPFGG